MKKNAPRILSFNFILFLVSFVISFLLQSCLGSGNDARIKNKIKDEQEISASVSSAVGQPINSDDELLQADSCGCPPEGDAKQKHVRELNKLKNRSDFPDATDFNLSITLEKLLEPGEDAKRWSNSQAARIKGYVWNVKPGGMETVNCKAKDKKMRDAHIELVLDPMNVDKRKIMVVEITPRIRSLMFKKGEDWTTSAIKSKFMGRWVEVEGWMMLDVEHTAQAENTNPGRPRNWRGTAWEIHPVTSMKVASRYQ